MPIRRLTPGEQALAAEVFGGGLDAGRVRIVAIPFWNRAFVASASLVVWPRRAWREDLSRAPLEAQATFVHELVHVWQAQNGVSLILGKIKAGDSPASYAYDLTKTEFAAMNIEQQAVVVEDAFRLSRGGKAPHPPETYAEASLHWRRA